MRDRLCDLVLPANAHAARVPCHRDARIEREAGYGETIALRAPAAATGRAIGGGPGVVIPAFAAEPPLIVIADI